MPSRRVEQLLGDRVADERRAVDLGGERRPLEDADHHEPLPADPHPRRRVDGVDAEPIGGVGAEHHGRHLARRVVEEASGGELAADRVEHAGVGRHDGDAAGDGLVDVVVAPHRRVDAREPGRRRDRSRSGRRRAGRLRQRRRRRRTPSVRARRAACRCRARRAGRGRRPGWTPRSRRRRPSRRCRWRSRARSARCASGGPAARSCRPGRGRRGAAGCEPTSVGRGAQRARSLMPRPPRRPR